MADIQQLAKYRRFKTAIFLNPLMEKHKSILCNYVMQRQALFRNFSKHEAMKQQCFIYYLPPNPSSLSIIKFCLIHPSIHLQCKPLNSSSNSHKHVHSVLMLDSIYVLTQLQPDYKFFPQKVISLWLCITCGLSCLLVVFSINTGSLKQYVLILALHWVQSCSPGKQLAALQYTCDQQCNSGCDYFTFMGKAL